VSAAPRRWYRETREQLDRIEKQLTKLRAWEKKIMATLDDVMAKVTAQSTVVDAIVVLVQELKANQDNPAKLQELVQGLDANTMKLAALQNTPEGPEARQASSNPKRA
jgi:hypothetical protein